jgi:hypothetical protein
MDISITGTTHATSDPRYGYRPAAAGHHQEHAAPASSVATVAEHDTFTLSAQAIARLEMKIDASQERLDAPAAEPVKSAEAARAGLVMELQTLNNTLAKALKDRTQASG